MFRTLVVALCCSAVFAAAARAQTRADSAAVLLNAAEQLRARGEAAASRAVLELIARQYAGTPAAEQVAQYLAALRRLPDVEEPGRTELMVFGATYGAWLGVAVPVAAESESAEAYGLGLLAGAPIGFLAARAYANANTPTRGQTRAITFGGVWGTYTGVALAAILDLGADDALICDDFGCYNPDSGADGSTLVASGVAGGLLGIGAGALLARKPITAGTAATISLGSMWGAWYGFAIMVLVDDSGDKPLTGALIGGNAALAGLALVAPRWNMRESRARLISVGGLVGGLAGAGLILVVQPDGDENTAILMPTLGSALGLAVAARVTRDRDPVDAGDGRGALINRNEGRWALDMPDPSVRLVRTDRGDLRPTTYVPILSARF